MSLLSVYCRRLRLENQGCLVRRLQLPPSHTRWLGPTGPSGLIPLFWVDWGLSALRDAEGLSSTSKDVARMSRLWAHSEIQSCTALPPPPPRSLVFLAQTLRAFKRNSRVSVFAKGPCLSVSVYRARPSPGSISKASPAFYKQ